MTDVGVKAVAERKQLQALNLNSCTKVSNGALKELAACQQLQVLDVGDCIRVSDAGLKELAACKQLKRLIVRFSSVTKTGVAELMKALPTVEVEI